MMRIASAQGHGSPAWARTARTAILALALALLGAGWACEVPSEGSDRFVQAVEALDPDLAAWSALPMGDDARAVVLSFRASSTAALDPDGAAGTPPWEALARAYDTPWDAAL